MVKISIVGAGSMFTRHIVSDILHMGSVDGGTIALIDVDPGRLSIAKQLVEHMIHTTGKNIKLVPTASRCSKALILSLIKLKSTGWQP